MDTQQEVQQIDPATCPHKHATIRQWYLSANVFEIRDGGLDEFGAHRAAPTGQIGIWCHDCDLDEDYWPGKVPDWLDAWVKALIAELREEATPWW